MVRHGARVGRAIAAVLGILSSAGIPVAQTDAGSRVFGIVVDERGEPLSGAEVRTYRDSRESLPTLVSKFGPTDYRIERRSRTDERGTFAVAVDLAGRYGIAARKGGELGSRVLWPLVAGQTVTLVARPMVERRGRVLTVGADGERSPVAGAKVRIAVRADRNLDAPISFNPQLIPLADLESDAEGHFSFVARWVRRAPRWLGTTTGCGGAPSGRTADRASICSSTARRPSTVKSSMRTAALLCRTSALAGSGSSTTS